MKRLLLQLYSYAFFNHIIMIYPAYMLMFQDHGLNMTQISILLMTWAGTALVLEIPTGILADTFPRKYLLFIAKLLKASVFVIWLGHNFYFYMLGFMVWALGGALHSGTYSALAYDELKKKGQERQYEKVSGRFKMLGHIAVAFSLALGGFVSQYSYNVALVLSSLFSIVTALIAWTLPTVQPVRSTKEQKYLHFLKDAFIETKKDKVLLKLIVFFVLVFGFYGSYDEFADIVVRSFGFSISQVGLVASASYAMFALAGFTSVYISKIHTIFDNLYFLVLVAGLLFLLVGFTMIPIFLIFLILAEYLLGVTEVKTEARLQHAIDAHKRATMLSINALLKELVAVIAIFITGIISQHFGVSSILLLMGGVFVVISFVFFLKNLKSLL